VGEGIAEGLSGPARVLPLLLLCLANGGCQTAGYYSQAIRGHCQVVARQQSIATILNDPKTPEPLKARLQLVLELRAFADSELKLPAKRHYSRYADLGRRFDVWNVSATPEFSMESKSWWYPLAGRLEYRGFFEEASARQLAAKLAGEGFDVDVGGVQAYSTLGWFSDPVLNTFIHDSEIDLAELLFHELAHQRLFVAGDTDFSEAFAECVAEEGTRRWLRARGSAAARAAYEAKLVRKAEFTRLITSTRTRLAELFCRVAPEVPPLAPVSMLDPDRAAEMRRRKQDVFETLRRDYEALKSTWGGATDYEGWFKRPLNNARLNDVDTYYRLVPSFHALLRSCDGDLEKFFREAKALGKLPKLERHRVLDGRGAPKK